MADQERSDFQVVLPWSFVALTLCWISYETNIHKWLHQIFILIWNIYGLKKQGY